MYQSGYSWAKDLVITRPAQSGQHAGLEYRKRQIKRVFTAKVHDAAENANLLIN
ncbi:hypothetical protein CJA_1557 [Cellvibrio japonicus Ueda107]|uniref:Uncharacterized protein n=1 Tax=Cellvibrio japonicus (strain Ueda107) TaxID=498211 RepID=B3PE48_CELJU|nr:hypothetical protein CJA_1557 [Cellvibrio japonicus Ueda107]